MKRRRLVFALAASLALVALGAGTAAAGLFSHKPNSTQRAFTAAFYDHHPENVIFFLGDGMGTQEITAARYYQGVSNSLNVDRMPFTGFDTTWSVKPGAGPSYLPDYDPDSASTGTMWATGQKTIDERISQGPSTAESVPGANLKTVLELAQKRGMKVGDVSTAEITDATPAVLASHISLRGCQGPANMAACPTEIKTAGGLGSIAEQEVDHKVDVLLGGGRGRFEQKNHRWARRRQDRDRIGPGQGLPVRHRCDWPQRRESRQTGARSLPSEQHVPRVEWTGCFAG
jgi:alkaline phosphatase/streptomycin-6-phosphatase